MKERLPRFALAAGLTAALAGRALANEHLMVVQEVFPGIPSDPAAQHVMLRMTSFADDAQRCLHRSTGTYGISTKMPDPRSLLDDPVNGPACP